TTIAATLSDNDKDVFNALKAVRLELARSASVPPYVICHDKTLAELAHVRPTSKDALNDISGLGVSKIKKYGTAFLDAIAEHS
ncbi:MAG: HRDC domain-containing protein, partial [Pseudomonadota bacterium]